VTRGRSDKTLLLTLIACAALLPGCKDATLGDDPRADPRDASRIALGVQVYVQHCASCHGAKLEGQPEWRKRLPNGKLPAPPHDETGHTWHHPDDVLFGITKQGLVPGKYAPEGYESNMPAFGGKLSDDEIWAVLAFIKSHWKSSEVLVARREMFGDRPRR
jgi:mono/diheme cytochrome c family protein